MSLSYGPTRAASLLADVIDVYANMFHERWDPSSDNLPSQLEDVIDAYLHATGEESCSNYQEACELASVLYQEDHDLEMWDDPAAECLALVKSREDEYYAWLDDNSEDEDDDGSPEDEARYEDRDPCVVIDLARFRDTGRVVAI